MRAHRFILFGLGTWVLFCAGQSAVAATVDLGAVMKHINAAFSRIKSISSDPSQNSVSVELCDEMLADIATARDVMPDSVLKLPVDQQAGQMTIYQQDLDQLLGQVKQMKSDFLAGKNAMVSDDIASIIQTKLEGHKAFKQ